MLRKITRALLSVSDKTGLVELATFLAARNVELISTGGTRVLLQQAGLTVKDISEHTGFPEILDGRVKTLHPLVHGGLLGRVDNDEHVAAMQAHNISPIELVVVNLYPFEATVAKGATPEECIENIDIGGPSMIRSAAKNHENTAVVTSPADYSALIHELDTYGGATSLAFRKHLAAKAFSLTASYDSAIANWFSRVEEGEALPDVMHLSLKRKQSLRYGENPGQMAALYTAGNTMMPSVIGAEQLQGKELSYNNINDADAALALVAEFEDPTVVIIKHANPCGAASGVNLLDAYNKALASDPVSAFGGIVAVNKPLDVETAAQLSKLFLEVIIAPDADAAARALLASKKNLRVLLTHGIPDKTHRELALKSIGGSGFLVQENDHLGIADVDLQVVTKRTPTDKEVQDMLFAFSVAKHVKSNAIVLAKDLSTIGIGAGQMSRVDSVRIATLKARDGEGNETRIAGAVVASDAFFPFPDGLVLAAEAGVTAAIQPGGSVRDEEVIEAANKHGIAMVFTGVRHFRH